MALLADHEKIVIKVAHMYCWTPEDRRDLRQEILSELWRSFPRYDETRKFSTWMYRVALNVAITYVRVTSAAGKRFVSLDGQAIDPADPRASQPDALETNERVQTLNRVVASLDAMNRALLLLYLEDHSYKDIAGILGISETNVSTKLNRLKQRLKQDVQQAERTPSWTSTSSRPLGTRSTNA